MTPATRSTLVVDGRVLEVVEFTGGASRAPLVFLHEGLGSADLWRGVPEDLHNATRRRVITFSRHGHGRSEAPAAPRTPQFFQHEALSVLPELQRQLGVTEPILIGHSDGASIALIHAASHPVSGLVLLAPHVFVEPITVASIRETREAFINGSLRERMSRYHDDVDAAFWGWCNVWLNPEFPNWSLEPELDRVNAPTLLIQGLEDPYGTFQQLDRIEARVPGAVRLLTHGGHSPHLDDRRTVIDAIAEFVAAQSQPC